MMINIDQDGPPELKPKLFLQAPMEDATDSVFRRMIGRCAEPDVYFTEFTNVDGLASEEGRKHVAHRLYFTEEERPIIAQIWGSKPENYYNAARKLTEMGFDGIDINMGCPQKNVVNKGLCAGLIEDHASAGKIIQATIDGAQDAAKDSNKPLPVSVKTRIGIREVVTEEWVSFLLKYDISMLTIHGRTVKQMSKVPADWSEIAKAVNIRDDMNSKTLIIGNGDVESRQDGLEKIKQYKVDGIMIGRAIFDNIFVFSEDPNKHINNLEPVERIQLLIDHLTLFKETWMKTSPSDPPESGFTKRSHVLKKYYKIYIREFYGASELREELMELNSLEETFKTLKDAQSHLK